MYQLRHAPEDGMTSHLLSEHQPMNSPVLDRTQIEHAPINTPIAGNALIVRADLRTARGARPYVALTLQCAGGATVEARWWNFPYSASACPSQGEVYRITACIEAFNGERQLRITGVEHIPGADLGPFVATTRRPLSELLNELRDVCSCLDEHMQALVHAVLSDQILEDFCIWPAAHRRHGAVRHGLVAHSLRVAELVQRIADAYGIDGLEYDRSLAVTAALLHDIGKLRTLPAIAGASIPEDAHLYDHVTLSVLAIQCAANLLDDPLPADRLDNLLHAVLAHHGRQEWGAAREPRTVEAWLVHLADLAESRLWAFSDEERLPRDNPESPTISREVSLLDVKMNGSMLV